MRSDYWHTLAKLLGASGAETIGYTRDYLFWIALSSPFAVVANAFAVLIRAEGKPVLSMVRMLLGNVINIILDPVFILGLDMGCAGAAVAPALVRSPLVFSLWCIFSVEKRSLAFARRIFPQKMASQNRFSQSDFLRR